MRKLRAALKRAMLRLTAFLLGIVLVVMLGATLYFQHLLDQINYVDPGSSLSLSQEELNDLLADDTEETGAPGMDPEDVAFAEHATQIGGKNSGIINILLIGQDRREGQDRARSDSMILCTFNKNAGTLTLTSFLRDLYVQIPGYENNRINAAYAAGGMDLLSQTLEENFGLHIDGSIEVDFSRFAQLVDLLGGVEIELRQDEADVINSGTGSSLTSGVQLLTGSQALSYARIRKLDSDGDFSRTSRQRKVIGALLDAYKNADLLTVLSLLDDILPMITTDLPDAKIAAYAAALFPMLSGAEIISQRIPADGTYESRTIDGMAVLVADMEASRHLLEETLLGK